MVKICTACNEVNAGGYRCAECGGRLIHTSDAAAHDLPESVWKSQRVDYGARRGMIVRFLAIFAGAFVGLYGVRASVPLDGSWRWIGSVFSIALGVFVWKLIHDAADRGVKLWVLQKGRVRKRRLARALLQGIIRR